MARLNELPFPAFLECVKQLLCKLGYQVDPVRARRFWRGRNSSGSVDFQLTGQIGASRCHILVQAKRYNRPVSRRFVDELRGAIVRHRATHGLILTTSNFSRVARLAATNSPQAPVRLLDREELLDCLIAYRVGVRRKHGGRWRIDERFFRKLEHAYSDARRHKTTPSPKASDSDGWPTANTAVSPSYEFMTWRTHVLGGMSALWVANLLPLIMTAEQTAIMAIGAAVGSLMPDLDSSSSKISTIQTFGIRPLALPSEVVERTLGHRGPLHSLLGLGLSAFLSTIAAHWIGWPMALGLVVGYASHLLLDAFTKHGVPLLFPNPQSIHLLPKSLRFTTGSKAEEVLFPFLAWAVVLLFLRQFSLGLWQ